MKNNVLSTQYWGWPSHACSHTELSPLTAQKQFILWVMLLLNNQNAELISLLKPEINAQ